MKLKLKFILIAFEFNHRLPSKGIPRYPLLLQVIDSCVDFSFNDAYKAIPSILK